MDLDDNQDGTPIWTRRAIDGPGVWVTCVKGKEKQATGEACDIFEQVGSLRLCVVGTDRAYTRSQGSYGRWTGVIQARMGTVTRKMGTLKTK